jgi:hypothetical protein
MLFVGFALTWCNEKTACVRNGTFLKSETVGAQEPGKRGRKPKNPPLPEAPAPVPVPVDQTVPPPVDVGMVGGVVGDVGVGVPGPQ